MILVNVPSQITCDEPGCNAASFVQLALMGNGGFAFRPPERETWQVGTAQNGTFFCRCKKHLIEQPIIQSVGLTAPVPQ